jgi:hypothetical protein
MPHVLGMQLEVTIVILKAQCTIMDIEARSSIQPTEKGWADLASRMTSSRESR